ncbi:Phosphoinositide phospholipase C [Bertholletia excelsa]
MFGCFNRKYMVREVEPPEDVKEAFARYAGGLSGHMAGDQLHRFLVEFQGEEGLTVADVDRIIHLVQNQGHHTTKDALHGLSLDDFFRFLFFDDLNGPTRSEVHHDMTAPLQHYFIYTGHNSYLTGNQLSSDCSDLPIIKALQRGVRVIELDLWPNSAKDDIHVLHGRTLTTPVSLIKCLMSIKEHAFVKTPYPLILTLEDHLTADLQAKVAEMFIQTFGELLYCPESGFQEDFPSPEALRHRVIVSTKRPKEPRKSECLKSGENTSQTEEDLSDEETLANESTDPAAEPSPNDKDTDQDDEYQYNHLIAIHARKPKHGLRKALKLGIDVHRLSLCETELRRAAEYYATNVVRFTQRNFLRVYPKGTRVTSSNFKPLTAWMLGAQMVAFNMQGRGKSLCLMHGMFRSNGGCGYVKKPDFLLKRGPDNEVFDPSLERVVKKTLQVTVFMGDGWRLDFSHTHFDTYSPPDFYTKVHMYGVAGDEAKKKTRVIEDNWIPVWDEVFTFPLRVPDLALLRIEVLEHDRPEKDDFAGQTCLLVSELRPGIRVVPLYDMKGQKYRSVRLLMRFQFV